jgi:hypothetical protein
MAFPVSSLAPWDGVSVLLGDMVVQGNWRNEFRVGVSA